LYCEARNESHEGTPLLYPIDDPEFPDLKGYSLFDQAHHIAYIILPAKHCKGQFTPMEQPEPPPISSPKAPQ